ncbi:MAG: 2-oxo acid dehydrogenase subunit E2 [Proteobacteria bacterium]|nr:2-oxo acid dehydrogenase subunit E2 [Pseudomonadota bacterium]
MAVEITMPQLSDTMSEGTILSWYKQEGDNVKRGEALAEVATDKADLEIESFHEGTIVKIFSPKGTKVKVGSIIALIGEKGETVSSNPQPVATKPAVQAQPVTSVAAVTPVAPTVVAASQPTQDLSDSERVKISPLAKNMAKSNGVDYALLSGTGDGGRIVKKDIEKALGREAGSAAVETQIAKPAPFISQQPQTFSADQKNVEPLSKMRMAIASRMVESKTTIPHFFATSKINVDNLKKIRTSLKPLPQYDGLTYNHLIIKAAALTLRAIPRINASYKEGNLIQPHAVNIGVVTAVNDGLLIPVLKNADQSPLADIVSEGRALVQRARAGRPKADDLSGATFSISNMGMFDVESFTAIISPGQGAILAVSPIQEEPVVVDGEIKVGSVMRLSLSVDHRIIDGVVAGEFLTEIKRVLEDPILLLA